MKLIKGVLCDFAYRSEKHWYQKTFLILNVW